MPGSVTALAAAFGTAWHVQHAAIMNLLGFVTGSGSPYGSVTPASAGQLYQDTVTGNYYIAEGTTNTSWAALTVAGSPFAQNNWRNLIDGGDFTINPWQRGTSFTGISTTLTYTADRWFAVGATTSSISVSQVANTTVAGFSQSLVFGRGSGDTHTAQISLGQVLESADSVRMQGQPVTFSFYAAAGANFSASALNVQVISGTGNNQSAANMIAGSWTGQTNVINTTTALTTTMTRYSFTGTVPAGCTQLGVQLSYTPVGTAGGNDNVAFEGIQLEAGGLSVFEHRDIEVELAICQRYAWVVPEPASGVQVAVGGANATANNQTFYLAPPTQLRAAPTVTVTTGSFKVAASAPAATATISPGTTHTPNAITVTSTVTQTVGGSAALVGGGGSGSIVASADF